jgi:hypothetical protein
MAKNQTIYMASKLLGDSIWISRLLFNHPGEQGGLWSQPALRERSPVHFPTAGNVP